MRIRITALLHYIALQLPNACKCARKSANVRERAQMSAKERKRNLPSPQKGAKGRKRVQKGAKEHKERFCVKFANNQVSNNQVLDFPNNCFDLRDVL